MPAGGVVGARKPGVRLSETDGTFAWVYLRRIETCGAFARAGEPQLKPPSPLRARNGRFRAFFGCRGVAGFNACCSGASSGDGGFTLACISCCRGVIGCIVATWLCPVREKVRPAWSGGGCEREKVRPACSKWPKIGGLWRAGRTFSRNSRGTERAGRTFSRTSSRGVPPGELCREEPERTR